MLILSIDSIPVFLPLLFVKLKHEQQFLTEPDFQRQKKHDTEIMTNPPILQTTIIIVFFFSFYLHLYTSSVLIDVD